MRRFLIALVFACWLTPSPAKAGKSLPRVAVSTTRISVADVLPSLGSAFSEIDLGPAPAPGGSRIIDRAAVQRALVAAGVQGVDNVPAAVRVVRKMDELSVKRLALLAEEAIRKGGIRKGITLGTVRARRKLRVAAGWDEVVARLPKPPRRSGNWSTTVMLSFRQQGQRVARVAVPVQFSISAQGALPDVAKGAPVTLVVRRGLIEIQTKAVARSNADVGQMFPVMLRPSGRVIRAKLLGPELALAMGDGR